MSVAEKEEALQKYRRTRLRHRRMTRLGLLAIFVSGLVLSGLMYFETTALAPGRAALILRFGELRHVVTNAGHVWRIPILDKVVQIDLQPQPLPTIRQAVTGSDGGRVTVELRATWQVADPAGYWRSSNAKPEAAARLIETEMIGATQLAARTLPSSVLIAPDTRQALAQEVATQATPALERAGLKLHDVRVTSVQAIR